MRIDGVGATPTFTANDAPGSQAAASNYASDWLGAPARQAAQPATAASAAPHSAGSTSPKLTLQAARVRAALANDVYNATPQPPPGWRVASEAELQKLGLSDRLLTDERGFKARVYEGPQGEQVIAFRGSVTRGDWLVDARQAAGLSSISYTKALKIAERIDRSPERGQVEFTGHSLGGGLASAAAVATGGAATTFNASGLAMNTLQQAHALARLAPAGSQPRVDAYYVQGEALSTLQDGGAREVGELAGGLSAGGVGVALGSDLDPPPAYGARHPLAEVPPPGAGFFAAHNPVSMHGMGWVERGLDRAIAQAK